MKKRFLAVLLVLMMAACLLPTTAVADSGASPMSVHTGGFYENGYMFHLGGETRYIPYGTICSRYQNSTNYYYVHTAQFILFDFSEYYENMGYYPGDLDGIFGPQTEAATAYYQNRKGLSADGRVGDQTWTSFVSQWVFG